MYDEKSFTAQNVVAYCLNCRHFWESLYITASNGVSWTCCEFLPNSESKATLNQPHIGRSPSFKLGIIKIQFSNVRYKAIFETRSLLHLQVERETIVYLWHKILDDWYISSQLVPYWTG